MMAFVQHKNSAMHTLPRRSKGNISTALCRWRPKRKYGRTHRFRKGTNAWGKRGNFVAHHVKRIKERTAGCGRLQMANSVC